MCGYFFLNKGQFWLRPLLPFRANKINQTLTFWKARNHPCTLQHIAHIFLLFFFSIFCVMVYLVFVLLHSPLFSSLDTKGHVRYCHHLASVVVIVIRKFIHFNLLLLNNLANCNQTW